MITLLVRFLPIQTVVGLVLVIFGLQYAGIDVLDQALQLLGVCACTDHWWYFW